MDPSTRTDITVNVEGFWMLQALLDIRHVAPELRCRPYVSTDSNDWLSEHPGMAVMREQGIVVDDEVNEVVAARMRVLAAPDLEVVALLSLGKLRYGVIEDDDQPPGTRDIPDNEFRVLLARRGEHWVSAVRVGTDITVDDVSVTDAASIAALVIDGMESIHHADPAQITAVNVPMEEMLEATQSWQDSGFNIFTGETCAGWGSAPRPSPRWARRCRSPPQRPRCMRGNTVTTPKAPVLRCCRSKTVPAGGSRCISRRAPRGRVRPGWRSARPPRSWSRWASRPFWTPCPTVPGKPIGGSSGQQVLTRTEMSCDAPENCR